MERGRLRRASSEAGLDADDMDRQLSHRSSEPPASMRRPSIEPPATMSTAELPTPAPPQQPPELAPGPAVSALASATTATPPQQPAELAPGPSDALAASSSRPRGLFEALTMTQAELEHMASEQSQVHPLLQVQAQVEIAGSGRRA